MSVQISIFHYSPDPNIGNYIIFNDILVMQVKSIRELTDIPYKLNIINNEMHPNALADLKKRLLNIEIIDVPKHEVFCGPAGINGAILNNKCDYLVILHTDVLATWNWLSIWLAHVKSAENYYGVPCAVSPEGLLLYPKNEGSKHIGYTIQEMQGYIEKTMQINWKSWNGIPVGVSGNCPPNHPLKLYDVGNELGLYMAHRKFWEEVGLHDETMISTLDGIDMGLRTLKTRCRNLLGGGLWLHHIGGLHLGVGCRLYRTSDGNWIGESQFTQKWGTEMRTKVAYGTAWIELHKEQKQRTGK